MSTIPCPACGRLLPEAPTSCPGCHLPLTGPDAVRLWEVDQGLAALQRERASLLAALRATVGATVGATPAPSASVATTGAEERVSQPPSKLPWELSESPSESPSDVALSDSSREIFALASIQATEPSERTTRNSSRNSSLSDSTACLMLRFTRARSFS